MPPIHSRRGRDHGAGKLDLDASRPQRRRCRRRGRVASGGDDRNKPNFFLRRQNQRPDPGQSPPRIDRKRSAAPTLCELTVIG